MQLTHTNPQYCKSVYEKEKQRPIVCDALHSASIFTIYGGPPFLSMNTYTEDNFQWHHFQIKEQ